MSDSQVRIGGSGFTVFLWRGKPIAYARTLSDTTPAPVAAAKDIQPLDAEVPIEIITPRALGSGTFRIGLWERWDAPTWQALQGLENTWNILDIFKRQLSLGDITCQKVIKKPDGSLRITNYYGCVVTDVDNSETIEIGTMDLPKSITIRYLQAKVI